MKDILIVAHFVTDLSEGGNSRFIYIVDKLLEIENNISVELVTSSFSHVSKIQRDVNNSINNKYKIKYIYEPSYYKNVSLKRFYSHYIFSKNVETYLRNRKLPDVIYCAIPSLDVGYVVTKYCKKNNIKLIIDIQDLWPEAFKMVFDYPIISDIVFYPMERKADYIYKNADEIVAVSETYVNRALSVNKKVPDGLSVFLGTDLNKFDEVTVSDNIINEKKTNEMWLVYVGTLGHSYNIKMVIDSLEILKNKGMTNIKFLILGDGPLKQEFEEYAKLKEVNYEFKGRLPYDKMIQYLKICDISVNPISKGAAQSIINKVGDYAAAGLPVLNTQENKEYRSIIELFNCGINCNNDDCIELSDKLEYLINNTKEIYKKGKNNRILAEKKFDRRHTYINIINLILN